MAFQITDYPGRLLVEEKYWLTRMELIEIRKLINVVDELDDYIYSFLESNIEKINRKSSKIKELFDELNWLKLDNSGHISLTKHEKYFYSLYKIKRVIEPLLETWQDKRINVKLLEGCKSIVISNIEEPSDLSVSSFIKFCNEKIEVCQKKIH